LLDSLLQEINMTKRLRSEDEENLSTLVKNHISDREVNNGVLKEVNMKSVYEKTLEMLYRGQKNVANNNAESGPGVIATSKDRQVYRQLCLLNTGSYSKHSPHKAHSASCCSCIKSSCYSTGDKCYVCRGNIGVTCLLQCNSCGKRCCGSCDGVRNCIGCPDLFCDSCATPNDANGPECICHLCLK